MKHCEQTWNGTAKISKPPGRKLPLHHLHNSGGNANTKTLEGEIRIGGKSDGPQTLSTHIGLSSQISRTDISECRACDWAVKTQHLVARTFYSVSRTLDHHTHLLVAQGLDGSCLGCVAPLRILNFIHSQRVSSTTP